MPETIRLDLPRSSQRPHAGDYDVDGFAVEYEARSGVLDFWLQLGRGLGIYRAFPAAAGGPLRVLFVDSAVHHVEEPELAAARWCADIAPLEWKGALGTFAANVALVGVRFDAGAAPAYYRCTIDLLVGGAPRTTTLSWGDVPSRA